MRREQGRDWPDRVESRCHEKAKLIIRAVYQNERESDRKDAEILARLARSDEKLLHPVEHVGEEQQRDLLQIKKRDNLVRQRVDIISSVRFPEKPGETIQSRFQSRKKRIAPWGGSGIHETDIFFSKRKEPP